MHLSDNKIKYLFDSSMNASLNKESDALTNDLRAYTVSTLLFLSIQYLCKP